MLPLDAERRADRISAAVAEYASGAKHSIALTLAGALLRNGEMPGRVPQMIARIMMPYSTDIAKRMTDAKDTCMRWNRELAIDSNLQPWPNLHLETMRAYGYLPEELPTRSIEEISVELKETMRNPGDGLTLIQAQCGLGKTTTWREVAIENAAKPGKIGVKSALSVPTTKVAKEQFEYMKSTGQKVMRRFGPLSVLNSDGQPECRYHAQGQALAHGGISVAVALCRGCGHRSECKAVDGFEGDEDAKIALGPHELVSDLVAFAGTTGLVAIDEPPELLEEYRFTLVDVDRAFEELGRGWFSKSFAPYMKPILNGVLNWMKRGKDTKMGSIRRGLTDIDPDLEYAALDFSKGLALCDVVSWAENAVPADYKGNGPPLHEGARNMLRADLKNATLVGEAGRIVWLIRRAVLEEESVSATVEVNEETGVTELILLPTNDRMCDALRRGGPTVLMAADANVVRPLVERVLGYTSPLLAFRAPEPLVERTLWNVRRCNRRGWLQPTMNVPAIVEAFERVVTWYMEDLESFDAGLPLAIVTFMPIRRAIQGEGDQELTEKLRAVLARLPRPPVYGHYGGLRGLDEWKGLDSLATVGDPYQNVDTLRRQMEWAASGNLHVATPDFWDRMHAAAELEQAHGRLRTVHRTTKARQLHVGSVEPAGWCKFKPRDGPPKLPLLPDEKGALDSLIGALGGVRAAARSSNVCYRTFKRWISNDSVPEEVVLRLREAAKGTRPR